MHATFIYKYLFLFQSGNPVSVSFLFVFHKIIKYIVPQWTICIIFGPLKCRHHSTQHEFEETDNIYWADKPVSYWLVAVFFGMFMIIVLLIHVTYTLLVHTTIVILGKPKEPHTIQMGRMQRD